MTAQAHRQSVDDSDRNWRALRNQVRDFKAQLIDAAPAVVADAVAKAGFHPYVGPGKAMVAEILHAHYSTPSQLRPLIPDVTPETINQVRLQFGYRPDFDLNDDDRRS